MDKQKRDFPDIEDGYEEAKKSVLESVERRRTDYDSSKEKKNW